MSNRTAGEKEDPPVISSTPTISIPGHAILSHYPELQAASKSLNQPMVPINLTSGKTGDGGSLAAIIPQALLSEVPRPVASLVTTAAPSAPSTLPLISSSTTPTIPQGSIVQISPGAATNVSSILRGGSTQHLGFPSHLPKGPMAAASAFAGPKSMTALPVVRHPTVSLQSPGTKVQTSSLIKSTTPPTSKSPTPGVTIAVTQASEGSSRTNVTVPSTVSAPQGSIQITLQAPRQAGEGISKPPTIQRTIDVPKPLIQALRTPTVDTAPKTIITTQARPLGESAVKSVIAGSLQRSLDAKQPVRPSSDPVIRPPKTVHVPQTSTFSGTKVFVTQTSNSSVTPHNLVTNPLKTNKGITIPSSSSAALSAALSSVTTTATTIPIAKVPPVRQPPLSLAPHTVSSTLPLTPSILERPRPESTHPGTAPPAHSTSTASVFMPHRTQPSTSHTAPSTLAHPERPALSSQIYPYFIPNSYLMQYEMQQALANAQPNVHAIPTISTASTIRTGLLQNQTPNLAASLQAAHTFSGTPGASVRFNQSQPVVVTMDTIRAQQALTGNLPFTGSTTVPESTARPTTPTDNISTLSSATAASIPIPALTVMGQCNPAPNYPSTPVTPQNSQPNSNTPVSTPNASPRPSILRKRTNEGPVKKPVCGLNTMDRHSPRPDSRTDSAPQSNTSSPKTPATPAGESQSSTDTALSSEATTPTQNNMAELKIKQEPMDGLENGLSAAITSSIASLSNSLPNSTDASPRKKPRKQLLNANEELKDSVSSDEEKVAVESVKEEEDTHNEYREEYVDDEGVRWTVEKCRPNISLMNFYNISWKPRNNHFNRHTEIKPKEERRPTVNELANQRGAAQKASGWKLYHMAAQMEDLNDLEKTLLSKLSSIQTALSPRPQNRLTVVSMEDELSMMHELTQANIQRCKLIMDQLEESRTNMLKVLDHKQKISEIINKHVSKRPIKKKERS
ncbi:histone deacetylase complex subunit SAP130-like isoform X1 [Saccostrea cucullata]|uniref:histone deacetylase complex subunit SAP130-like isoform X1 n=1 Tax=Saccostrea cuccullata TaxID=36930 RepID=UPI002ED38C8F